MKQSFGCNHLLFALGTAEDSAMQLVCGGQAVMEMFCAHGTLLSLRKTGLDVCEDWGSLSASTEGMVSTVQRLQAIITAYIGN